MAIDEALFYQAVAEGTALLRTYCWNEESVTLGYFSKWTSKDRLGNSARRWTGGGRVEHGDDLTFSLAIPRTESLSSLSGNERYTWIHTLVKDALASFQFETILEEGPTATERTPDGSEACFMNPVPSDLLDSSGVKIAGGAQRRVAGAILHQGSVRVPLKIRTPHAPWTDAFVEALANESTTLPETCQSKILSASTKIREQRYETLEWNQRR